MYVKKHFSIRKMSLLIIVVWWSDLGSFPVALLTPAHRAQFMQLTPPVDINAWSSPSVVSIDNQRIVALAQQGDIAVTIDSLRIAHVATDEIALLQEEERYYRLRSILARYIEYAHVFGDEGLAAAVIENFSIVAPEDVADVSDCIEDDVDPIFQIDGSLVIHQAVSGILKRYSFETLEGVSAAVKELEQRIQVDMKRYGINTYAQLVDDLQILNSKELSASYHCMKQVSKILGQLPPESAQAIREQFPWYLKRMV